MFTAIEVATGRGSLQYREENLTGFRCRISPERLKRRIDQPLYLPGKSAGCPFCRENIFSVTPTFPDGSRILQGESVTFPNMFPFAAWHTVTVITKDHMVSTFSKQQITDALNAQIASLLLYDGYPSINWNYLPSAGASMIHPHMQGISDPRPSLVAERYLSVSKEYAQKEGRQYWDVVREQELSSDRYLFGDEILWSAHAVPMGEREVRGILPVCQLNELGSYSELLADGILNVLQFYRKLGTYAFNMAIFFSRDKTKDFSAFCSLISRINPNPLSTSDSAFMERLHNEPIILTLPEDLGRCYRNEGR
ncbi:MAG: galactose-1-phosphate uridylyltransferase [Methanoregula sp.]